MQPSKPFQLPGLGLSSANDSFKNDKYIAKTAAADDSIRQVQRTPSAHKQRISSTSHHTGPRSRDVPTTAHNSGLYHISDKEDGEVSDVDTTYASLPDMQGPGQKRKLDVGTLPSPKKLKLAHSEDYDVAADARSLIHEMSNQLMSMQAIITDVASAEQELLIQLCKELEELDSNAHKSPANDPAETQTRIDYLARLRALRSQAGRLSLTEAPPAVEAPPPPPLGPEDDPPPSAEEVERHIIRCSSLTRSRSPSVTNSSNRPSVFEEIRALHRPPPWEKWSRATRQRSQWSKRPSNSSSANNRNSWAEYATGLDDLRIELSSEDEDEPETVLAPVQPSIRLPTRVIYEPRSVLPPQTPSELSTDYERLKTKQREIAELNERIQRMEQRKMSQAAAEKQLLAAVVTTTASTPTVKPVATVPVMESEPIHDTLTASRSHVLVKENLVKENKDDAEDSGADMDTTSETSEELAAMYGTAYQSRSQPPPVQILAESQAQPSTQLLPVPVAAMPIVQTDAASEHGSEMSLDTQIIIARPRDGSSLAANQLPPYVSPFAQFKQYRFHTQYLNTVKGGYRSFTYSNHIDVNNFMCPATVSGMPCYNRRCSFQHFSEMVLCDDAILIQMGTGSGNPGQNEEDQKYFTNGLRDLVSLLRSQGVGDVEYVAAQIANYRREFIRHKGGDVANVILV